MGKAPEGRTFGSLCSRLHHDNPYRIAREEGCSPAMLGHHRGDMFDTFFRHLFHGVQLATVQHNF
jgi:tRNA(Ile)-lysidine synthase TilS/MesJ